MSYSKALKNYQQNNLESAVNEASPHKLVEMLLRGAIEKINLSKQFMEQGQIELKGLNISQAISIIDGLQASLDKEKGGDLASNLFELYDYCIRKLIEANLNNDQKILDEVSRLMDTVKSAWDDISDGK